LDNIFDIKQIMKPIDEQILRATKEIVVKFIELGRLSPTNIHESFRDIYHTIDKTVKERSAKVESSNGSKEQA